MVVPGVTPTVQSLMPPTLQKYSGSELTTMILKLERIIAGKKNMNNFIMIKGGERERESE